MFRVFVLLITVIFTHKALSINSATEGENIDLNLQQANSLAQLPLKCLQTEYPNKLGQTLDNASEIGQPRQLHPAFYGCFDWHSSVHGHWSAVTLLKQFPQMTAAAQLRKMLSENITQQNIVLEVAYFKRPQSKTYERTYGWAWLLKLALELKQWDDPLARELEQNLQPLTDLIVSRYIDFLPRLKYPIRVGEHTNTAFGLVLAWDFALATDNQALKQAIETRAQDFYMRDKNCPLTWEPSGYDFLSPCLQEIDLMRRVLSKQAFKKWVHEFLPSLLDQSFDLKVGEVSDRSDGKLVHLDGLNFSRAWVMYGLSRQHPQFKHLREIANQHVRYSLPNLVGDSYEGGHWLASFAIYALQQK